MVVGLMINCYSSRVCLIIYAPHHSPPYAFGAERTLLTIYNIASPRPNIASPRLARPPVREWQ